MYAIMFGACINCNKLISYNPHKVPSIRIPNPKTGELGPREPLCRDCAEKWNELHPEAARPIQPDAYEYILEEEL